MLNRRSFSDVLPESPKSARKKEEARQAEFVRVGQVGFTLKPFCARHAIVSLSKPESLPAKASCLHTPLCSGNSLRIVVETAREVFDDHVGRALCSPECGCY